MKFVFGMGCPIWGLCWWGRRKTAYAESLIRTLRAKTPKDHILTNVPKILASGAVFGECIEDLGLCREFNSNASDENAKSMSLGGRF